MRLTQIRARQALRPGLSQATAAAGLATSNREIQSMAGLFAEALRRLLTHKTVGRWLYQHIYYHKLITRNLSFFNAGVAPVDAEVLAFGVDAFESHQAQVYHEAVKAYRRAAEARDGLNVLEVACGLGGGVQYLRRVFPAAQVFAVDLSLNAIRRSSDLCGAHYAAADAQQLPFKAESFAWVVAVECLHKLDVERFFAEAGRVLQPGGVVCAVDFRAAPFPSISQRIANACAGQGLRLTEMADLTGRLLQAIDAGGPRQRRLLQAIPRGFRQWGRELMAMPGSQRHASYLDGRRCYYLCAASAT